ncbi:MAG: VWA domain-containing protein [Bacteroidetes bacterium]|nr:VWA domain-containing protein [Bacteroidota bacterium]
MFRFGYAEFLYLFLLLPVVALLFVIAVRTRRRNLQRFGDSAVIFSLIPEQSSSRPVTKFVFVIMAMVMLFFGIACPQFGSKLEEVKREGVELIIALDVSNSMLAEDIQPNRLERAKRAVSKLIDRLHNDKIGLIVFAGQAYTQLPITLDYAAAKMFLSTVTTDAIPIQGTAIGAAIEQATESFSTENDKNKAIIIITDGENHEDNAVEAASTAASRGIIVHTIGMGLPKGAPIPVRMGFGQRDFRRDKEGNVVITKLDETMLQQIAAAGNGNYIRANNTTTGLNALFEELDKMEKQEFETTMFADYENKFRGLFAMALIFILFDFVILNRKNRWFRGINIFKNNT